MTVMKYLAALVCVPSVGFSCDFVADTYQTVSESEWSETIEFRVDGSATIIREEWEAGSPDSRDIDRIAASWICEGSAVTLKTSSWEEKFRYSPALSFANIGQPQQYAPGLSAVCSSDKCGFSGKYFWQLKAIRQSGQ